MPVHRIALAELEERVAEIEKSERIVAVDTCGDGAVLVVTEPSRRARPGDKETRPA